MRFESEIIVLISFFRKENVFKLIVINSEISNLYIVAVRSTECMQSYVINFNELNPHL